MEVDAFVDIPQDRQPQLAASQYEAQKCTDLKFSDGLQGCWGWDQAELQEVERQKYIQKTTNITQHQYPDPRCHKTDTSYNRENKNYYMR